MFARCGRRDLNTAGTAGLNPIGSQGPAATTRSVSGSFLNAPRYLGGAQAPALAQIITASATRARRSSKASNGARHRASMLAAAAQTLFMYKRGAARPCGRAVAKQHGVPAPPSATLST
ncbi:hypothetical protein HaLaN_10101 [Haematococcus lacustris]|uniref:Uncharacterized protein n=1 Tax=Haematococcus lacustris TaxID=44745 RepID=A0A699Z4X7_HAELA|nr:hypothetical protein HaLaN_10101 [Haematococcus lacustris]